MNLESPHSLTSRLGYGLLAGMVVLHIALAVVYANITPYRTGGYLFYARSHPRPQDYVSDIGAPDERQHANYVIHLLQGKGLPINRVMVPDPAHPGQLIRNPEANEEYEYLQAPLYYVLDAWFGRLAGVDADGARDSEVGKRLRYLNALFGAGTVLGVYFLGIWGVRRRDVAFLAASIAALLPMNLALSGSVSNDPLLFCLCTWCIALCARGVREGWDWETRVPMAILLGLALLTKQTALDLIPVVLVAFLLRRPKLGRAISTAVIAALIALPLWVRNQKLYGDPFGLLAFQSQFAGAIKAPDMMAVNGVFNHWFNYVGWYTVRSFFGVFGYMDVFLNERGNSYTGPADFVGPAAPNTLYRFLFLLAVLATIGFLLYLAKAGAQSPNPSPGEKQVHLLNAVFLGVVVLLFIRYNMSLFQGQARYLYPAIGPIFLGLAIGTLYWAKSRTRVVMGTVVALLIVLNVYALTRLPSEFAKRIDPQMTTLRRPA